MKPNGVSARAHAHEVLRPVGARGRRALVPAAALLVASGGLAGLTAVAASASPTLATWAPTGSLALARTQSVSAVLPNGDILVAGGLSGTGGSAAPTATAERYATGSGTWSTTGSMSTPRDEAVAQRLADGDVLIAGGVTGTGPSAAATATTELYNAASGTFSASAAMPSAVFGATSAVLSTGQVLVIGGDTGTPSAPTPSASVELYTPSSNSWSSAGSLATPRANATATVLTNGTVLVAGGTGSGGASLASAELFTASTNAWTPAGALPHAASHAIAQLLSDGTVLVAGGADTAGSSLAFSAAYSPGSNSWSATGPLNVARADASSALLPDGDVLVAGGFDTTGAPLASAETYDPSSGSWSTTGSLSTARGDATMNALGTTGSVLVAGGTAAGGVPNAGAELYFAGIPAAFTSSPSASFVLGTASTLTIATSGLPAATITESGVLPAGLSFVAGTNGTATITGTPTGATGTYNIELFATNGVGEAAIEWLAISVSASPAPGYLEASATGAVRGFGQETLGATVTVNPKVRPVVAVVTSPLGGYYLVTAKGNVYNEAGAPFFGSKAAARLAAPISAFATTPDGTGYWLLARDGSVYPFGSAVSYSSLSVHARTRPIVAIASSADGKGYYLVSSLGNVFNYGDAAFYGSKAATRLPHPVVGFATTADSKGYWIVTSGGNIYNLGDAPFYGSKATVKLAAPIVALAPTHDAKGYYLVANDGTAYTYGNAPANNASSGAALPTPVIGLAIAR